MSDRQLDRLGDRKEDLEMILSYRDLVTVMQSSFVNRIAHWAPMFVHQFKCSRSQGFGVIWSTYWAWKWTNLLLFMRESMTRRDFQKRKYT